MSVPYEKIVAEDLNLGAGTASVTMPAGGSATGNQIGQHTMRAAYGRNGRGRLDVWPGATPDTPVMAMTDDGTIVSTAGTTTNGVQEALNYAQLHGHGLVHFHAGYGGYHVAPTGTQQVFVNVPGPITIPANQNWRVMFDGLWNYTGAAGSVFVTVDTQIDSEIRLGAMVYGGTVACLEFKPQHNSGDGVIGMADLHFHAQIIANNAGTGVGVRMNTSYGGIAFCEFRFTQLGGFSRLVDFLGTAGTVSYNTFHIGHPAGKSVAGGFNPAGIDVPVTYAGENTWYINGTDDLGVATGPLVRTDANNEEWHITAISSSGSAIPPLIIGQNADGNTFYCKRLDGGYTNAAGPNGKGNRIVWNHAGRSTAQYVQQQLGFAATTPAVPASGTYQHNETVYDVEIFITNIGSGSMTYTIRDPYGSTASSSFAATTSTVIRLCPGESVALTYTGSPSWVWRALR